MAQAWAVEIVGQAGIEKNKARKPAAVIKRVV
jgi:hypothetical protein